MKTLLAILILAAGCQAASAQVGSQPMKEHCAVYIAIHDNGNKADNAEQMKLSQACLGYVLGLKDEMEGELAWGDGEPHKTLTVGNWQDRVTPDQAIRVFVKYANDNPALLNKPATMVFRQSMEAAGLYTYTPVTLGNTQR
jgi:Rap1a immunity proteins